MARLRINSEATVKLTQSEVAALHECSDEAILDWGNGYAVLDVDAPAPAPDPEPEAVEESEPKDRGKPEESTPKPRSKPKVKE